MGKPTVGLTGGIATGKSTVSRLFAERGIPTVDADRLAREVVAVGTDGLAAIVEAFGAGILQADGSLDRKRLGDLVFHDAQARERLEAILHPRIATAAQKAFAALADDPAPYVLYEAALLVEKGMVGRFDALVVVTATPSIQIARMQVRNGLNEAQARERLASQWPLARKEEIADFVIRNEGDLDDLARQVDAVHGKLLGRFGSAA